MTIFSIFTILSAWKCLKKERVFSAIWFYTPLYEKGIKQKQNKPMETNESEIIETLSLGDKHNLESGVNKPLFSFTVRLPIPAYLLALTYFYMSLLSLILLAGLRTQRTRLLLGWLLVTLLTQFPEGGMVLFMAIYYWVSLEVLDQFHLGNRAIRWHV